MNNFFPLHQIMGLTLTFVNTVIIERAGLGLGQWVRHVVASVRAMVR